MDWLLSMGWEIGHLLATTDAKIGKIGPSLRVAARIGSSVVLALDFGTTKAFGLGLG